MDIAPAMDFDISSLSRESGYYNSAPSSPTRLTEWYGTFDELLIDASTTHNNSLASVPFAWEEKPGVPKTPTNLFEDEFTFDVSSHFDRDDLVAAEDLFHRGQIKTVDSPKGKEAVERDQRGRGRRFSPSSRLPSSRSRRTRSLSPLGASDYRREQPRATMITDTKPSTNIPTTSSEYGSRKWSFIDLFLFRSASDGRAMDRDPLKKYSANLRKHDQDVRNAGSMSKRRERVSAHELHYNVNRAVSNDMKKKTYLPYKQGILGRFSFNP